MLFVLSTQLNAQDTISKNSFVKFEFELPIVLVNSHALVAPSFIYGNNFHSAYFAPILPFATEIGGTGKGFMTGYKLYPNKRERRASLYFAYNFLYTVTERREYKTRSFYNLLGYGFELRFLNSFYFMSECSVGYLISKNYANNIKQNNYRDIPLMFKLGIKKRFRK
jgi:hypothetical protein